MVLTEIHLTDLKEKLQQAKDAVTDEFKVNVMFEVITEFLERFERWKNANNMAKLVQQLRY